MSPGIGSIILVVILIVLLFGRGKISALMGDLAKGITSFKKGLKDVSDDNSSNDKQKSEDSPKESE
ncbi:MAG: twin-arginine translocase TatA/TatE family subunit [Sphingomonadales bacterium]